jgi:Second BRCT domain on Nijmegen syndrome breakage protein
VSSIIWQPVVLSFNFPSKDTNGGKDPLAPIQTRIEDLDVQAILPYDRAKTTHVVANKRNTAKSLQALVNGKYVVDHPFIDALVYAATPSSLDEPESLSPLEIDFDANFPRALDYVPPPSKEPGQRPAELFEPDPARQAVFENYIFVFGDQRQCELLAAPIPDGSGSALHLSVLHGSTTPEEIVAYLREVNNKKASDTIAADGDENILLVAFKGERSYEKWADEVQRQVQNLMGLEIIEQNEFLDVILMKDPGRLKRKVPITGTST